MESWWILANIAAYVNDSETTIQMFEMSAGNLKGVLDYQEALSVVPFVNLFMVNVMCENEEIAKKVVDIHTP